MRKPAKPRSVASDDFLTTIFRFVEQDRPAISARLAEALGISAATAFGTVKRMARDGLVKLSPNKEITLTPAGNEIAENVIRRHRLAERFLTDILKFKWHVAYSEAHRLEHGMSSEVADKLAETLGNPSNCPHGYPIPGSEGYAQEQGLRRSLKPLDKIAEGGIVEVERVPEDNGELLQYLDEHNVSPTWTVKVTEVADFKGTRTLELDGHQIVISADTAAQILVKPS